MRNVAVSLVCLLFGIFLVRDLRAQKAQTPPATTAGRVTELEHKLDDLELTVKVMSGDIDQLKFDRMVDSDSIQGFQGSVDDLHHDLDAANVTKLHADVDALSKRVAALEDRLRDESGSAPSTQGATR